MKNKFIILALAILIVLPMVNAEVTLWKENIVNKNTSIMRTHGYYQFFDESKDLIGRSRPVPLAITWSWQDLPYNISTYYPQYANALVDWCNFTVVHGSYSYNSVGEITGYTEITYNEQLQNVNSGMNISMFQLKHNDALIIDFDCHYTNPNTVFIDSTHFGDFGTWLPAYTCTGCEDSKLEELAKETEYNMQKAQKEILIYQKIQSVITINYTVWTYLNWILKIGLVIGAIFIIFGVAYFFYMLLSSLAKL